MDAAPLRGVLIYNGSKMNSSHSLISVIITNYNYGKFVAECIKSVLDQTYKNIEVIIIDDGSTDNSVEIIEKCSNKDSRVKLITQKNKGVVFTRNKGLKESSGDFFVFIDADDTIPRDFVEKMVETAQTTDADVVYCDLKLSDRMSGVIEVEAQSIENFKNFLPTPICQLVRKKSVGSVTFDENLSGIAHEDNDFFFNLFLSGAKFAKANTHYNYRIHGEGRSPEIDTEKHYRAALYMLEKYKNRHDGLKNGLIDILIDKDHEYKKWHDVAEDRYRLIHDRDIYIRDLESKIELQTKGIEAIVSSLPYKVAKKIANMAKYPKKIMTKLRKK